MTKAVQCVPGLFLSSKLRIAHSFSRGFNGRLFRMYTPRKWGICNTFAKYFKSMSVRARAGSFIGSFFYMEQGKVPILSYVILHVNLFLAL